MIDIQQILQTIHRNQQQIDLLTSNNTQLIEQLMDAGAVTMARALLGANGHQEPPKMVPWREVAGELLAARAAVPALPEPRKQVRPKGSRNAEPEQRLDTLGRRIPGGGVWTPERRAAQARRMKKNNPMRAEARAAKLAPAGNGEWTPERRAAQSIAMKKARAAKAKLGLDWKTGRALRATA